MNPAAIVWQAAVFGPIRRSPGRTTLSIIVIALGVALGFAVHLINRTAADEISRAARSLYGLADFAVDAGPEGFDELLYPRIARLKGVAAVSPVVEVIAKIADRRGTLKIAGIDAFRSRDLQPSIANLAPTLSTDSQRSIGSNSLLVSASAARDLGLAAGDSIDFQVGMQRERFSIAGVLPSVALEDRAALMDIATAQWKFDKLGKLTRINVRLAPGANPETVRADIAAVLPHGAQVMTPGEATDDALRLSRAYRANLTALALVALFTGAFLVYSTQTLAILRRRRELAVLHALGVTHRQQVVHTLVETTLVGFVGATLGVGLGFLTATYALELTGADLGAGYVSRAASGLYASTAEVAAFIVLGMLAAIAGAAYPALQAARIATATSLKSGDAAHGPLRSHGKASLLMAIAAAALCFAPSIAGLPLAGYASIALVILATIVAIPSLLQRSLNRLPTMRFVPAELAISHLRGSGGYATLSVAAIVVSFSLMVAMLIMVTSFRHSLDAWTERILPADVYLRVGYIGQSAFLDESQLRALSGIAGVERTASARFAQVTPLGGDSSLALVARDIDLNTIEEEIWLEDSASAPLTEGTPVWISEAAADRHRWRAGSRIELPFGAASEAFVVQGIYRDYEHPNGAILIDRSAYVRFSGDTAINAVSFWLSPNTLVEDVQRDIRTVLQSDVQYDLRTPRELRRASLQVFDRTFAVTYVLEIVAIVIGLFGISAGISAQVLARRAEFGVLRHLGVTRRQIAHMLASEGAVLGVLGVIVGIVTGAIVSMILIYVVNRQSFHWSMDVFVPIPALVACSAILVIAAALIAVVSGRSALGGEVVLAVKEDW